MDTTPAGESGPRDAVNPERPSSTRRLVEELKVPLVIAGGPLDGEPSKTVAAVAETIRAGARGVIVGRNIWQRERSAAETVLNAIAKLTRSVTFKD